MRKGVSIEVIKAQPWPRKKTKGKKTKKKPIERAKK